MSRRDDIRKLLEKRFRYLQVLKEKEASFGLDAPPHILLEIQDIEAKIAELQTELKDLENLGELALQIDDTISSNVHIKRKKSEEIIILVIDDDKGWQNRLQRILDRGGYRVCVAGNVKEAEDALEREGTFDLITVDMHLTEGGGEGWDLVEIFTEKPRKPGIIIVSGADFSPTEVRDLLRNYGHAVDFVPKEPFDRERFKRIVEELLY